MIAKGVRPEIEETGCPFENFGDDHELGHELFKNLITKVGGEAPTLPPEQFETIARGTAVISVIRYTAPDPKNDTSRFEGRICLCGHMELDPDFIEATIRFANNNAVNLCDKMGIHDEAREEALADPTRIVMTGIMQKLIHKSVSTYKKDGVSEEDGDSETLPKWAIALHAFAGELPAQKMREALKEGLTPYLFAHFHVEIDSWGEDGLTLEGVSVASSIATGSLPGNIAFGTAFKREGKPN